MALLETFARASGVLVLLTTACAATGAPQPAPREQDSAPVVRGQAASPTDSSGAPEVLSTPVAPPPATPAPVSTPPTAAPIADPGPVSGAPVPVAQPPAPTPAYVPRTAHDNTPWRFNMQQEGRSMSADEFDAWMQQRGVRVATGKPATPPVQNCPTPEGDRGDSDGDGVINCLDRCPDSEAGQTIGPDGCPVPVSIDLKGVTFGYDKAVLEADAKAVLAEALEILQRHPTLKVEVAGHTDSRGEAAYNQALSERRARAVYDYLVQNGIDRMRLIGPIGFGESRPIAPNQNPAGSDSPEGRAKNRRTELNIQN